MWVVGRLLWDAFRKKVTATRDDYAALEPEEALLTVEVPPAMLMDRILAEDDLCFVSGESAEPIRRQFLQDRRRIALSWLGQGPAGKPFAFSACTSARCAGNLSLDPLVELRLLAHTLLFFLVYALIWSVVATYGAFWARGFVRNVVALTGRLSALGARILADADRSGPRWAQSQGHA